MSAPTPDEGSAPARSREIALPEHLTWRHVHPVTPLLKSWQLFAALVAFALLNTREGIAELIEAAQSLSDWRVVLLPSLIGLLALIAAITVFWLSWRAETYAVDADAVYQRTGIVAKQLRVARMPRIQSVDVIHPLLGRVFGLGQVTVEVAGGSDSRVTLGYLRSAELERLRAEILGYSSGALSSAMASSSVESPAQGETSSGQKGQESGDPTEAAAHAAVPVEEYPLYSVGLDLIVRSTVRSMGMIISVLVLIGLLVTLIIGFVTARGTASWMWAAVIPQLPLIAGVAGHLWNTVNERWNFRAFATPVGIRLQRGLSTDLSSTLPPGRVHAVELSQPLLWRGPQWWKVKAIVAGRVGSENESVTSGNLLLPVGDWEHTLRALWLVVPDLGVPHPDATLVDMLRGIDEDGVGNLQAPIGSAERGLVTVSPRSKLFAPLSWRRKGVLLTETCVIFRRGWWSRKVSVVPYERIQSVALTQGPLDRRLGTATLGLDLVEAMPPLSGLHSDDAAALESAISERALRRREAEALDRWLTRALQAQGSAPVSV